MKNKGVLVFVLVILLIVDVSGFVVDHTNAGLFDSLTQEQTDRVRDLNWFFAHRSVGRYIMEGMDTLNSSDNLMYGLLIVPDSQDYENHVSRQDYLDYGPIWGHRNTIGLPDFTDFFEFWEDNYDIINVGLTKHCYIDFTSIGDGQDNFDNYKSAVDSFVAEHPDAVLIHFTAPLKTDEDSINVERNLYRDLILNEYSEGYVFDLADIESWYNNQYTTFDYDSNTYLKMNDAYTQDGGHPTTALGEEVLAKGLWVMMAQIAEDLGGEEQQENSDVNSDGNINVIDLAIGVFNQGKNDSDLDWDFFSHLDLNSDGNVDCFDIQIIVGNLL